MTFTIPVWLAWLLGIVIGVPLMLVLVLVVWVAMAIVQHWLDENASTWFR